MKMLSLFSGIGGIDLAAQWAGVETIAFCEIEPFCQKVLQKHWPYVPIFDDVRTITKQALAERGVIDGDGTIDIVAGGYPCQPFSMAGKRKGTDDPRHLWPEMFRIIKELRPTWVIGENVAGHISMGLDVVLSDLESEGYQARAFVLPASSVGAPHQRNRIFVVAYSDSLRMEGPWAEQQATRFSGEGERMADSDGARLEGAAGTILQGRSKRFAGSNKITAKRKTQSTMGGTTHGIPRQLDGRWPAGLGQEQHEWEPTRVINDMSGKERKARLTALGNAVVPQQIYPIFKAIVEISDKHY